MTGAPALSSADALARRTRADVFFGIVAPTGIRRASFEARVEALLRRFGYQLRLLRVSDLLEAFRGVRIDKEPPARYLESAMNAGTRLRQEVSADCLARAAMLAINGLRQPDDAPTAWVIWSLKHPEEVATLRLTYGGSFHLIGLYATEHDRLRELLTRKGMREADARDAIRRDEDESGRSHGQKTRDTFQLADVFVPWGSEPDDGELDRFLGLVFGDPTITPTRDEHRMFLAFASATRSGELGRQVGAVLTDAHGDVLAVGSNDVPRRGGGTYWPTADDQRDHRKGHDSSTVHRRRLMRAVADELGADEPAELAARLDRTSLRNITEYGRAVHAEMDALLACGRTGRSTRDSTLYVTTFPCHNCARHAIAAGVRRIVYVEPYPKSRAVELHADDLAERPPGHARGDPDDKVSLEPFVGIGPRRFFDYFSVNLGSGYLLERKDRDGEVVRPEPDRAAPRVQASESGYLRAEQQLAAEIQPYLAEPPSGQQLAAK
jgi:deoxycytidylate deaminase